MIKRLNYWQRIASAYILGRNSHLTFWHEKPAVNEAASYDSLGPYYMTFADKAGYPGPFSAEGVPILNYRGKLGPQFNPIAIAQYGLAHYNRYCLSGSAESKDRFLAQADWLVRNPERNPRGLMVWNHHFDFDYHEGLRAPWYSGLAQGQGLSVLARAYSVTGENRYLEGLRQAYEALEIEPSSGGVCVRDSAGDVWIEEYLVNPPSHILNGFLWALWGVRDFILSTGQASARRLFSDCVDTLERNLQRYDTGFWSLYETSSTAIPMIASHFYHRLHIVQLKIMFRMTGRKIFHEYAERWQRYAENGSYRMLSLAQKCAFKVLYY